MQRASSATYFNKLNSGKMAYEYRPLTSNQNKKQYIGSNKKAYQYSNQQGKELSKQEYDQFIQMQLNKYQSGGDLPKVNPDRFRNIQSTSNLPHILDQPVQPKIITVYPQSAKPTTKPLFQAKVRPQTSVNRQLKLSAPPPLVVDIQKQNDSNLFDLRDGLWDEVYLTKIKINQLKEENSNLRAKIFNLEKENRRFQKQIDNWNLEKGVIIDQNNQAFVDTATTEKVYNDANFNSVSLKEELKNQQQLLKQKEEQIKEYEHQISSFKTEAETLNEALSDAYKELMVNFMKLKDEEQKLKTKSAFVDDDNVENLVEEANALQNYIKEITEKNKMMRFEILTQRKANGVTQQDREQIEKQIESRQKEIESLQNDLKEKGVTEDYTEIANCQKKRQVAVQQKSDDEIIEEKEKIIQEQLTQINELDFQIQEMTRQSLLEKQDVIKDIQDLDTEIAELEEKYLDKLTQYNKLRSKKSNQSDKNLSINETTIGSEIRDINIQPVPTFMIKEIQSEIQNKLTQ